MSNLSTNDFQVFFEAVHGYAPFPWQQELARNVVSTGSWPSLLDLPTGSGKTAAIDIAVFHLAMEAQASTARKAPLRIFFVIDRRIVVDEAFNRANRIASALRNDSHPILKIMAQRLSRFSGHPESPLGVVRLRGGMPLERDWARSPAQPLVAVSTVDQLGSRLLFRGYGVSSRMCPVHAGLVGADALWLLDEVHLSQPFEQTLSAIEKGHASSDCPGLLSQTPRLSPFQVVKLSATPGVEKPADIFPGSFDIRKDAPNMFLQRLSASKITELIETKTDPVVDFARHALRLLYEKSSSSTKSFRSKGQHPTRNKTNIAPVLRMAVVVNRVAFARQVFEKLSKVAGDSVHVLLLTGRIRPLDRERIMGRLAPLFSGVNRHAPEKPIIVVATQTIEAGADFDVDALITEIAPLDCLRQRFGRLDRLGLRGFSRAVILFPGGKRAAKKDTGGLKNCPWRRLERIYGEAPFETWQWLTKITGLVDFGVDAMNQTLAGKADNIEKMLAPRAMAPYLLPPYADLWSTTWPTPPATPEPSLFLHGPGTLPEVRVAWRSDIQPANVLSKTAPISLELCPPASSEALSLPLWGIKRWLTQNSEQHKGHGNSHSDLADIPQAEHADRFNAGDDGRMALRSNGEGWNWISARDIRPDDLLVVPATYGGCDEWGWNPDWKEEVVDYGFEAHYEQRLKCALRITPCTLRNAWKQPYLASGSAHEAWRSVSAWIKDAGDDLSVEALALFVQHSEVLPETWQTVLAACAGKRMALRWLDDTERNAGFVLSSAMRLSENLLGTRSDKEADGVPALTGFRESSAIGVEVTLPDHSRHVELLAADFCTRCGIADPIKGLLILAARLHDLGKAEPRFQIDLHGGGSLAFLDPFLATLLNPSRVLLAKSARIVGVGDSLGSRRAAPKHFRHEALSVALAKQHPAVMALSQDDRDLVLWLIGTHHGYGRPFFPPCAELTTDIATTLVFDAVEMTSKAQDSPLRLDQGWFELAERVKRRFGPWELARLEAIVRLADHTASAEEQEKENWSGGVA